MNSIFAEDDLKDIIDNSGADLVFERLWASEAKISIIFVSIVLDFLVGWNSNDFATKITDHSTVLNASTVVISHIVVNTDSRGDVNVILWEHVNHSLNDTTVNITTTIVLNGLHSNVGH